jgi:hypothetical protein
MQRAVFAPTLALRFLAAPGARADMVTPDNVQWTYNFSPASPSLSSAPPGTGGITFTNEPTKSAVGSSDVVATNLRVFSATDGTSPEKITDAAYKLSLVLTETENGVTSTKTLTLTGALTGTLSKSNANVTNTFTSPASQQVSLGSFLFTLTNPSFTPPGPPDQTNAGSISAHVAVTSAGTPPPTQSPEPSSMLLAGLGLTVLGGAAWRKRQARAVVAA